MPININNIEPDKIDKRTLRPPNKHENRRGTLRKKPKHCNQKCQSDEYFDIRFENL